MSGGRGRKLRTPRVAPGGSAARVAWVYWAVCAAMILCGLVLLVGARGTPLPPEANPWGAKTVDLATLGLYPTLAALMLARRPRNVISWLFCAASFAGVATSLADAYAVYALWAEPGSLPCGEVAAWAAGVSWAAGVGLVPFLLLLFPNGGPPSRRWRALLPPLAANYAGTVVVVALAPGPVYESLALRNPLAVGGAWGDLLRALERVSGWSLLAALVLALVAGLVRFRNAGGDERQQLKWVAGAIALLTVVLASTSLFDGPRSLESLVEFVAFLAPPVAVGIAMLRHRLYDVDRIINRTLVYVSVTGMLAALYLGGVALLQGTLRSLTGGETQVAVVASTLAVAALFRPLRGSTQRFVDRRFYRAKYDAEKTLEAFTARLRAGGDLASVGRELVGVVGQTMNPEHASLWLQDPKVREGDANVEKSSVRNVYRNGPETGSR